MIYVNIIILIYALITMTILLEGCLMEFSIRRKRYPYFIESVVSAIVMLVSDLIGWIAVFWRDENIIATRVYNVSYFISSAAYFVLLVFFVRFLIYVIESTVKGAHIPKWLDYLNIAVCGVSAGFWAVNSVNGLISTSTVNGTGHRGRPVLPDRSGRGDDRSLHHFCSSAALQQGSWSCQCTGTPVFCHLPDHYFCFSPY